MLRFSVCKVGIKKVFKVGIKCSGTVCSLTSSLLAEGCSAKQYRLLGNERVNSSPLWG